MQIQLNGTWQLRNTKKQSCIPAEVPGDIFLAHLQNRLIPDPYYGTNEKKAYKLAENDFEYFRKFTVSKEFLKNDTITLVAEQIDTIAQVYINNVLVAEPVNAHTLHRIEVKKYLKEGENSIKIVLFSPIKYIEQCNSLDRMPPRFGQTEGVAHIRKPQCHFGWDWGINLPIMGITRDIYLEAHSKARIANINTRQIHHKRENGNTAVELKIDAEVIKLVKSEDFSVEIKVIQPDGKILKSSGADTLCDFLIESPELWWTRELSGKDSQPLYEIQASVYCKGELCDTMSKKIGLRTIELLHEADKYGTNFQFVLNGVPLFIKGANFIPPDAMITRGQDKLAFYIDSMLNANMNMVRIWGGGYYQTDAFYDYCDRKGLLVWQDFCFACMPYPFYNQAFLNNVLEEVASNVARLKHHASLAVWCGNNEIEQVTPAWRYRLKLVEWTKKFFYNILPAEIGKSDKATPYIPGSPTSFEFMKNVSNENYGSKHIWSVWHGLKPISHYRNLYPRFAPEFGMQSLPSMDMIQSFARKEDYSLSSEVMKSHQKCIDGNDRMLYYLAGEYRLPNSFEHLPYLTGLTQACAIKQATEHMRINRGRCNGTIYWQLNDCWGVSSWASIDYSGKYKPLQYRAKKIFAPLTVCLYKNKDKVDIYLINDLTTEQNVRIEYGIKDFSANDILKTQTSELCAGILSVSKINSVDTAFLSREQKRACVFYARLYGGEQLIAEKTLCLVKDKRLALKEQNIAYNVAQSEDNVYVTVKANGFLRQVGVDIPGQYSPFDDNYFDLLPGESKTIRAKMDKGCDLSRIKILCLNNIMDTKSLTAGFLLAARVRLKPVNLLNSMLYLFNNK
ncbi:MAG: beta-mannosidase [Christensenellales bacterium]|jgi:beta-mannosidase